uniref:Ricin B-type lectin domain-containing protein n=2 Tax=Schistosoma mansoni TaxID=6183 RepID=A0A5K4FCU2_SCHMA
MHLCNSNSLHLDIIWIKAKVHTFLYSLYSSTSSQSILLSSSLSLPTSSSSSSFLSSTISKIFFKLFSLLRSLVRFNDILVTNYLGFYVICIKCLLRLCLIRYRTIITNKDVRNYRYFKNNHRIQLSSRRHAHFHKHLSWYKGIKTVSDHLNSSKNMNYETTISDTVHNECINAECNSRKHFRSYSYRTISSESSSHRFEYTIQYYAIFLYILFALSNVQCINGKPTSLSINGTFAETSSSIYSSNMSSSGISPNSSLSPPSLIISSNHTTEASSVDDLMIQHLDLSTFQTSSSTHSNRKVPITNVFMRSHRSRRSLSFYMSNLDTSPLFLTPFAQNHPMKARFLSIDNNGTIKLVKSFKDTSALITISIIAEWSTPMNKDSLLKLLKPRDGSRVILRKFAKNICICMHLNGTVYTERIINQTLTDNCEWHLRVSRHGIGFEHQLTEDDITDESQQHSLLNPSNNAKIYDGRSPTLNVIDEKSYTIASGWTHQLWQPEATWQVYGFQPKGLLAVIEKQRNSSGFQRFVSMDKESFNQSDVNNTSTISPSSSSNTVKIGSQKMLVLEAPAYYFNTLHHKAKLKHCSMLKSKLVKLVQTELLMSLQTLDKYRQAFQKFTLLIYKHSMTNHKYNINKVASNTVAELLDQWLMLLDYKWRQTIRLTYKADSVSNYQVDNCSLSFKSSFEINTVGNDSDDRILVKFYETQLKTKIYYDLFEIVQDIVQWTDEQKQHWLQNPRVIKLFHYLHIKCPSSKRLRQASFILRRYLPNYSPEVIHPKNNFHFGLMGSLEPETFKKFLAHDIKSANKLIDRAVYMKFEEYYFWPILRHVNTKAIMEHSIFFENDVRNEIKQMPSNSMCYRLFMRNWKFYRENDSSRSCLK